MRKKYKLTGFSRLVIFMIFFTPLAYIGASYYNGEDGIENIRAIFEKKQGGTVDEQIATKQIEIDKLNKKIESLNREIKRLESSK